MDRLRELRTEGGGRMGGGERVRMGGRERVKE
jgi:hypothetical protein